MRRREFVAAALAVPVAPALARDVARLVPAPRDAIRIASPNGSVEFELRHAVGPRLSYGVTFRNQRVIEPSPLGIVVDGVDLGQGVEAGTVESYYGNERYPWRGVHAEAINRFKGARIAVRHTASATDYLVEVRVFDDGIGFRCVVPGEGSRVPDEATAFVLPARATVWYHDLRGHYEGTHTKKDITEAAAGDWAAPPLTVKLPDAAGYAAITEAAVINYSGMVLQADGQGGFRARLGHAPPASYPFTLRYGEAEAARLAQPAAIAGTITTPWRVVMIGPDLNALVNCDIVPNLSPPPEPRLFPKGLHTDWIKPSRAVWKYLDGGGENTLEGAAEHRLMVNFHGANKPTGESRTWPNELNREAVSGMERKSMVAWSQHDTTIPFTRMLAGHLDFTPMLFGERRRETSWAHQIATAALFTAPLLVYGAHPKTILEHPAAELIRSIPSVWDETRVLPFSEIGEVAAFARRHGKRWFVVIANGPTARSVEVPLSFLGGGSREALLVRDAIDDPAAVRVEHATLRWEDDLTIDLRPAGGFVARFA